MKRLEASGSRAALAGCLGALAVLAAGCAGIPVRGEKEARARLEESSATFRPDGQAPELPALTAQSGLGDFLRYAMLNQPAVAAAYYDWAAAVERVTVARSLPDPQFTFEMDIQNVITSVMPGLMAAIPWPGRLRGEAAAAGHESEAAHYRFQTAVLENAYHLKRAYYQLYFLEEKIRVSRETLGILADLEQLARTQNEVGKVTLQDVLRAQIERDRVQTQLQNLEDSRTVMMAQFQAALGMRADEPPPPLPTRLEGAPLDLSSEQVLARAAEQSLGLKALEAEVRAAEASLRVAQRSRYPDFSLGLMADAKMDPVMYRPLGTVTLPIWRDKIAARIAEARANRGGALARLSNDEIQLGAEVAERLFLYRESTRNLELLSERLLPKARSSLEVARSGYLSGQITFFNLADTERTLLAVELDRVEASLQRETTLAELSLIIQGMPPAGSPMAAASSRPAPGARQTPGM